MPAELKITFCFPYRPPSGVATLFARLAVECARRGLRVRAVDYADGFLFRSLGQDAAVERVEFRREGTIALGPGEFLVLQAGDPTKLHRQLRPHRDTRLVCWQLHPHNFVPSLLPLIGHGRWLTERPSFYRWLLQVTGPGGMRRMRRFVGLLDERRSLFFYDRPAWQATEGITGLRLQPPVYVPIPIEIESPVSGARPAERSGLHVGWVGRLYDFKIHILIHTIERLSAWAERHGQRITFHVIGDGPEKRRLLAKRVPANCEVRCLGDLSLKDMEQHLRQQVDFVAAMGTAALHGAVLGLPVMLLDLAYAPVTGPYRFRWLQDTVGFDLGHVLTVRDFSPEAEKELEAMMARLRQDPQALGMESYRYCAAHHSLGAVTEKFLAAVAAARLTFGEIPLGLLRKGWIRRAYEHWRY